MKCSINMVLIAILGAAHDRQPRHLRSGRAPEAADGPKAALWTGDRRRWPEDAAPAGPLQGTDIDIIAIFLRRTFILKTCAAQTGSLGGALIQWFY